MIKPKYYLDPEKEITLLKNVMSNIQENVNNGSISEDEALEIHMASLRFRLSILSKKIS